MTPACVIGIGNEDRGDDAAGLLSARVVRGRRLPGVTVHEMRPEPHALMEAWQGAVGVHIIDACARVARVGKIHRFEAHRDPLPEPFGAMSSHGLGLGTTLELARALGVLPPRVVVFAIEASGFEPGGPVSPEVDHAARTVAHRICEEIGA
jgi:hydrogenase maturation protease